jgi:hypothetical protein
VFQDLLFAEAANSHKFRRRFHFYPVFRSPAQCGATLWSCHAKVDRVCALQNNTGI